MTISLKITSTGVTMTESQDIPAAVCQQAVFINRRRLVPGAEVSIYRKRGRFRFISASYTGEGKLVLNFVGGRSGHEMMRSFYPEQVKAVHRDTKLRR